MNEILVRIGRIERIREQLIKTQQEMMDEARKFQVESKEQISKLMSMMITVIYGDKSLEDPIMQEKKKTSSENMNVSGAANVMTTNDQEPVREYGNSSQLQKSVSCEYHAGAREHSIENCSNFKRQVRDLLAHGVIEVDVNDQYISVKQFRVNPRNGVDGVKTSEVHTEKSVERENSKIKESEVCEVEIKDSTLETSLTLKKKIEVGSDEKNVKGENQYLTPRLLRMKTSPSAYGYDPNSAYDFHLGALGHHTDKCIPLMEEIEKLVDKGVLTREMIEKWGASEDKDPNPTGHPSF
ncbi:hypothetical protein F3Y22_tig00111022pilonHSYRG00364 [Hibiscus syriacus]|uniref:Uncharacterized protein n=1 Tax=Hibiscus syriacus TaxID=106335 RepID=A0A6A2Z5Z9_HIBSY|nr:hypothetical protein F3Y22_tig00111022pilonHSYRG00364 [Hibiscus syriacus]